MGEAEWRRPSPETAPTAAKASGLYMIGSMAKVKAEQAGYADALMLDWRGLVAETTGANIFFVIDGAIAYADTRRVPRWHHPAHRDQSGAPAIR